MSDHPLDRAVWTALSTRRAALAIGDHRAKRFAPTVGLFAAAHDPAPASLTAMAALVGEGEQVVMLETERWPCPPGLRLIDEAPCIQMVATDLPPADDHHEQIAPLTDDDAPAMLALATLTRPGPFLADTHRLGGFVGISDDDGRLVAMAGTRLSLPGYVEVSGVCTHPDHRGRGYAALLVGRVARAIAAAGDTPYLTTYADNGAAIALYERLGFRRRREMPFTALERG